MLLLCLLAWPLLALIGLTLRVRLLALLVLVAIYVPVTGAGPSIQRAAVMGGAGLIAALVNRPSSRWYALSLAAAATLSLNPRASGDVGWQLSFAAVVGILLWTGRLAALLDGGAARGSPRRALAEGFAMTVAATVATAPLMGHHFDAFPLAALPANLLALPAVAPAMWLGMLAGLVGQVPALPVEPLNWLNSLCLAYIAQIARWLGAPSWALLELPLSSPMALCAAYAALLGVVELALRCGERLGGLVPRPLTATARRPLLAGGLALLAALAAAGSIGIGSGDEVRSAERDELRVRFLDVGQGDAILLDPPDGDPLLVDAGPAGADVGERLRGIGVRSLAALIVTHDQADHSGGASDVIEALPVARLAFAVADERLLAAARAAGAEPVRLAEGGELRSGSLRLTVLWPPAELLAPQPGAEPREGASGGDPNRLSLVLLAEWRHFSALLPGDAEAEATPLDPGPIDVLKIAHHGSEDGGLDSLLDRTVPDLAVISVGDNPYGHPTPETVRELRSEGVRVTRTDEEGDIEIEADGGGWRLAD